MRENVGEDASHDSNSVRWVADDTVVLEQLRLHNILGLTRKGKLSFGKLCENERHGFRKKHWVS